MGREPRASDGEAVRRWLRREAAASRPPFSPAFQARIEAALSAEPSPRRRVSGAVGLMELAGCAAAGCLAVAFWLAGGRDPQPLSDEAARVVVATPIEPPSIEQLPLLEEVGAQLLAGTAAFAAEVVGLPRWNDLVDAGTAFAPAGDDWPGAVTP